MKRPIILVFPIAELLFYASAIPIQQNRDNGIVGRSLPSYPFAFDSALTQRSEPDGRNRPSFWMTTVLNPATQSTGHDAGGAQSQGPQSTEPSTHAQFSHAVTQPGMSSFGIGPSLHPSTQNNQPAQRLPHTGADPNRPIHPTLDHYTSFPSSNPTPPFLSGSSHEHGQAQQEGSNQLSPSSTTPEDIPVEWYTLSASQIADELKRQVTGRTLTPEEVEKKVVSNMQTMTMVFEKVLAVKRPSSSSALLGPWRQEMRALSHQGILPQSKFVQQGEMRSTIQMEAIAKLYNGMKGQSTWDGYWIDNRQLHTTNLNLVKARTAVSHDVLTITANSLLKSELSQLTTAANGYQQLLTISMNVQVRTGRPGAKNRIQ
ncbi:hypothetical protein H0H93_007550, partial [Arthromyces matolae]